MRKSFLVALMAIFGLGVVGAPSAQAIGYYGQFYVLKDRSVRAYFDVVSSRTKDGWCYDNGGSTTWDCVVDTNPNGANPRVVGESNGKIRNFNGRNYRAQLFQPYVGWKPYCYPTIRWTGPGVGYKEYFCAYWVPA